MTRLVRIILIAAVVVIALVVGGTYLYIHVIEGDAPAPLTLNNASTTSGKRGTTGTSASAAGIAGTWKPTSASIVGYRVKEILFGQDNTAVGRTNAITGSLVVDGTTVSTAQFTVD